jgi:hypothetical protein
MRQDARDGFRLTASRTGPRSMSANGDKHLDDKHCEKATEDDQLYDVWERSHCDRHRRGAECEYAKDGAKDPETDFEEQRRDVSLRTNLGIHGRPTLACALGRLVWILVHGSTRLAFHLLPDASKHGGPRSRDCRLWSNAVADHFCLTAILAMLHLAPPYNAMGLFTLQCSRSICCRMCRNTVGRVPVIADHGQTR